MNIEHKTEPVEHWIVDGKAYRLAMKADVGKVVYRSSGPYIEDAIANGFPLPLLAYVPGVDEPYTVITTWAFAYVQDDSLLTPQRVPVPALGDGWFLLRQGDVVQQGDKFTSHGPDGWVNVQCSIGDTINECYPDRVWARYFGPAKPQVNDTPIDWSKPVRTKDGRVVRVLCTDGPGEYPVVGFVSKSGCVEQWTIDGKYIDSDVNDRDLENIPPEPKRIRIERWVNVYDDDFYCTHDTKEICDRTALADRKRFACVKITIDCEEGEGL